MKRSNLSSAIYLLLVFLSGTAVGGFAHRLYLMNTVRAESAPRSPEEFRRQYMGELQSRLNLTADQVTKVNEILDVTRRRYRDLHERSKPEIKAIQDEQVESISAILTDKQRPQYQRFREERAKARTDHSPNKSGLGY